MDIAYILGNGSLASNEEIRYSLRSIHRHMLDIGKVYVVGEKPEFLRDIKHIACDDTHEEKWKNAFDKVRIACLEDNLSKDFLLMNDDFFANNDFKGDELPYYAIPNIDGGCNGKYHFGIHAPIQINKELYLQIPLNTDLKGDWSPRSFYSNFYRAKPTFTKDFVIRSGEGMSGYDEQVKGAPFYSIDNHTMTVPEFATWVQEKLPEPSPWEL